MAQFMQDLRIRYHLDSLSWHFSATSHGKGAIDGVGGTLKRLVWRRVKARHCEVRNAEEFAMAVCLSGSTIETVFISSEDIDKDYSIIEPVLLQAPKVNMPR